ncbi:UNVERIFIED_CONTAM: Retrovirus-related Pol polyprotein from transposon RE2 [Sesamum angustifolium]|uniref:Retrovirus-related Pol polyprotein from transposon RE2 n=1 Tax=Sesamum angustifolium TaxID=2727405 RepID=A0AAW2JZV1_9LAMI
MQHTEWQDAMKTELDALEDNCTWKLTPLPEEKHPIGCKKVFKTKLRADGSVERYKAHLVAKGFNQIPGVDYNDNFSPVAKTVTVRLFLALAAARGWPLQQMDVNNSFLHGHLNEDLYMTPPEGYSVEPGLVCKLESSIYRLKQASRQWNAELMLKLTDFGFQQSTHDHCLFTKDALMVSWHFLCKYRRLVGRLLYLGFTRPDISYSVQQLSQFLTRPCEAHWKAAVHVVRYLKGTPTKGLFLPSKSSFELRAYCDADWASCSDSRRSLTGFCIFFGDALISWKTMKQSTVSRTTAEAEYRSTTATVCELK